MNEQFDGTNDFTERSFSGKTNKNDNFENERIHLFFEQLKKGSFRNNKQKNENKSKVPISTVPGNQLFELKAYRTFAQPYPSPIQIKVEMIFLWIGTKTRLFSFEILFTILANDQWNPSFRLKIILQFFLKIDDRHLIRIIEKNFSFVKFTSNFDDWLHFFRRSTVPSIEIVETMCT